MPSSTTLRTSTPSGVPALSSTGYVNRLDRPARTAASRAVRAAASRRSPPSSWATAGEAGRRGRPEPGQLEDRAVADVPGAGLGALARVVQRVPDLGASAVNHGSRPGSLMPNVVPLRAIVVTIDASATWAALGQRSGGRHHPGRKNQWPERKRANAAPSQARPARSGAAARRRISRLVAAWVRTWNMVAHRDRLRGQRDVQRARGNCRIQRDRRGGHVAQEDSRAIEASLATPNQATSPGPCEIGAYPVCRRPGSPPRTAGRRVRARWPSAPRPRARWPGRARSPPGPASRRPAPGCPPSPRPRPRPASSAAAGRGRRQSRWRARSAGASGPPGRVRGRHRGDAGEQRRAPVEAAQHLGVGGLDPLGVDAVQTAQGGNRVRAGRPRAPASPPR